MVHFLEVTYKAPGYLVVRQRSGVWDADEIVVGYRVLQHVGEGAGQGFLERVFSHFYFGLGKLTGRSGQVRTYDVVD